MPVATALPATHQANALIDDLLRFVGNTTATTRGGLVSFEPSARSAGCRFTISLEFKLLSRQSQFYFTITLHNGDSQDHSGGGDICNASPALFMSLANGNDNHRKQVGLAHRITRFPSQAKHAITE